MNDLIYTENYDAYKKIKNVIQTEYENAEIEDASDGIHTNRFSVDLEIEQDDWFLFICKNGFAWCSLGFQLVVRREPERVKKLISKLKGE